MEMFATIQGEGFHTGRPAFFIRLGGCDIGCTWCDVKESWDAAAHPKATVEAMVAAAEAQPARFAVITGGEPCQYDLEPLTTALHARGFTIALETSGAYPVRGAFDWVCVSPKKFRAPLDASLAAADELKVIVAHPSDLEWGEKHAAHVRSDCRLFLQPEYERAARMLPGMIDYVRAEPRWRIGLQIHKYIGVP
jgi:organic radical activating enzyme